MADLDGSVDVEMSGSSRGLVAARSVGEGVERVVGGGVGIVIVGTLAGEIGIERELRVSVSLTRDCCCFLVSSWGEVSWSEVGGVERRV